MIMAGRTQSPEPTTISIDQILVLAGDLQTVVGYTVCSAREWETEVSEGKVTGGGEGPRGSKQEVLWVCQRAW